jgi:hypothetical protein
MKKKKKTVRVNSSFSPFQRKRELLARTEILITIQAHWLHANTLQYGSKRQRKEERYIVHISSESISAENCYSIIIAVLEERLFESPCINLITTSTRSRYTGRRARYRLLL